MTGPSNQVVIVGAGPVGLTLAADLGMQGIACTVVERKAAPEFLPKMERCNARTMEIFRRMGLAAKVREAGLDSSVPMDVYVITKMTEEPLLRLEYPSVDAARRELDASEDTSQPAEPYQLISQYTLEPLLKEVVEALPSVDVCYGNEFIDFRQDSQGVTTELRRLDGTTREIRSRYLVGCDGAASQVRKKLGIRLRGEGNILKLRQALFRSDALFERLPMGKGPGRGRHYHVADNQASFLIMQDSTRHWTLHAIVDRDEDMSPQFEKVVGSDVDYELLHVGEWKQNLLLADRYGDGRVFLAGDAVHLVIPTGGLGMNTGVGDAVDLSWKLAAVLKGWGGPNLLRSYEAERRPIGDRNIAAARYASLGRRKWRAQWAPGFNDDTPEGKAQRDRLTEVAEVEQRKTNEMIGAELGYRYADSPIIVDEPGGPEHELRAYNPVAWTGVRMPHVWLKPGSSINDIPGRGFKILRFGDAPEDVGALVEAFRDIGAPVEVIDLPGSRLRDLYGCDLFLLRPDLHIAWRGNALPREPRSVALVATGYPVTGMARHHAG